MNLSFSSSLKQLTLVEGSLSRKEMKIFGSLPNLEVLKLRRTAFFSQKWITNAGEFLQLKYLLLENIALAHWRVDRTHFPNLEHLVLENFYNFGEIPDEIREIPTLRSIKLNGCGGSVLTSAIDVKRNNGDWEMMAFKFLLLTLELDQHDLEGRCLIGNTINVYFD
ncbi:putative late blight resistance protein-like protein R1B-16 [Forsythia ovata]|uniref:Late blight resistance protein-like protein R1B-16 n=1 Tax=Forsythia ovata TaxID=205694 RepID=A0ABD1R1W9_9LAMI